MAVAGEHQHRKNNGVTQIREKVQCVQAEKEPNHGSVSILVPAHVKGAELEHADTQQGHADQAHEHEIAAGSRKVLPLPIPLSALVRPDADEQEGSKDARPEE